ncbi:MAG: tetratricopeptide repeat protein [bacterium]|nr:tetratricopeptide repeat protein [bacterium]
MEKISVIIPVRNTNKFINEGLSSIFNSTYRNLEVILIQDGLIDNIEEEVEEFNSDIIVYKKSLKNNAAVKNFGFKKSSGEFLSFYNIDDINGKMRFELSVKKFEDRPRTGMVFCSTTYINNEGAFLNGVSKFPDFSENRFLGSMFEQNRINTISTALIKTEVFKKAGGFNEKLDSAEDYDLFLKIGKLSKVEYIDLPLLRFRPDKYPFRNGNERFDFTEDETRVLKKFDLGDIAAGLSFLYDKEADFRFSLGMLMYKMGRISQAALNFNKAGKLNPGNCEAWFFNGNCCLKLKKYENALEEYKKCLSIKPEHAECHNNMGVVYNLMGDSNKSEAKLKKALKLNGELIGSLYESGIAKKHSGKAQRVFLPVL